MGAHHVKQFIKIVVRFEERPEGGLRAWSDDLPGFVLSHPDAEAVLDDVEPALETMLSSMYGVPVMVAPLVEPDEFESGHIANRAPTSPREYASHLCAA
jgi:hypothetical protein